MMNCSKITSGLLCALTAFVAGPVCAGTPSESTVVTEAATHFYLAQAAGDRSTGQRAPGSSAAQPPAAPLTAQPPTRPLTTQALPGVQGGAPVVVPVLRSGEILLNFQAADLQAVVKAMSQMTGRNMLVDPRVRG